MFFDFMLDVRSHDPHGERTDGGFIFQIDTIQAPDPIEDIEIDSFEDPPNTPTIETCNLTAMGTLFGSLCVDELLQDPESVDDDGAELQNPENLDDDGAEIFPLDNDVLPLLAENQFPGLRWDVLRPVMQVASKLLESPASQEYLYAVFISRLRDIPCADQPSRTYRSIFRKETLLTAKERKVVKRRLQQMAAYVTFSISDIEGKDVQGYCQAQATKVRGISGCSGVASHIVLNRKCYKQYCDHFDRTSADSAQEHKDRVQRLAFRMVTTLCHELAHAFCHARFSPKSRGLGFENQCISEEGFDWESCVFGGMVSSSANCAAVTDWPCASRFDVYSRAGNPISVARVPEHDVSIDWKVPATYVRSIFQPSTWEQPAPDLKVPKLLGYRNIPCASRGVCQCYDCQKTALLTAARIERGTGKLDYEKLSKDTITVMRTLKQTTPPCPRILRKMRAAAKTNAENNNVAPDGADASSPPTNNDSTQALDYDFWCEDPRDPSNEGDQFDEDLDQYEPYLYGDCHREAWGHYPYGRWDQRAHGTSLSLNPATFGVPEGYVALLDGSLVRGDKAQLARQWEEEDMEDTIDKAGILLDVWKKEQAEGWPGRSKTEKMRVQRLVSIVRGAMESEDPVVRRMVGGIKEVDAFLESDEVDVPEELEALGQVLPE